MAIRDLHTRSKSFEKFEDHLTAADAVARDGREAAAGVSLDIAVARLLRHTQRAVNVKFADRNWYASVRLDATRAGWLIVQLRYDYGGRMMDDHQNIGFIDLDTGDVHNADAWDKVGALYGNVFEASENLAKCLVHEPLDEGE